MSVLIQVYVIGVVVGKWTDKEGEEHTSYKVNYSQNSGQHVGQLNVPEKVFEKLTANKEYILEGMYSTAKTGNYLRITGIYNERGE